MTTSPGDPMSQLTASWHSLSGYLYYKQGGALSKLKSKKRQWYVLDESQCRLQVFKNREDARTKTPIEHIELRNAGISIGNADINQFIVLSESKEHQFIAENHESMMIWLMGMQAKRDMFARKHSISSDHRLLTMENADDMTMSLCPGPSDAIGNPDSMYWTPVRQSDITWNFEKFLIGANGKPVRRYNPTTSPFNIRNDILEELDKIPKKNEARRPRRLMKISKKRNKTV